MRVLKNSLFTATVAAMGLTGCGGGDGSTRPVTTTYAGVAVDGYLQGAKVCFDTNGNLACDSGEASATTDAAGKYSLQVAAGASGNVVVEVGADAIDSDTGKAVGKAYVLTAPAGRHAVVSPLTTLLHLQTLDGVPLDEAIDDIKRRTGISDPTGDYVAGKDGYAHDVARIAALALANKLETLKTLDATLPVKTALRIAGGEIDPAAIGLAATDAAYQTGGKLDPAKVAASDLAKLEADAADVKTMTGEAALADRFAGAAAVGVKEVLVDGHVNWLYVSEKGVLTADRNHIDKAGDFRNIQNYDWADGAWTPPVKPGTNAWPRILLSRESNSWLEVATEWKAGINADGTATLTNSWNGEPITWSYRALDLAGKKIADWIPAAWLSQAKLRLKSADATFPAGAKALSAKRVQSQAGYVLYKPTAYKSFDEVLALTGGDKGRMTMILGHYQVKASFAAGGKVTFVSAWDESISLGTGSWAFETVAGQQILVVEGSPRMQLDGATHVNTIFALHKGVIYDGMKGPKETNEQNQQIYNDAALDALAKALEREPGTLRIHVSGNAAPDTELGVWAFEGWEETYPTTWPVDRKRITSNDGWGGFIDLKVANGATAAKFIVLGANGRKSCEGDLVYTVSEQFVKTRFAEIWVEGCRVSDSVFARTGGYVEVFYKSSTNLKDAGYPAWGIWTWEGTMVMSSVPEGGNWPLGRTLFDQTGSTEAGPAWVSVKLPLREDQTNDTFSFLIADKDGQKSCDGNLSFTYPSNPAASDAKFNGLPLWQLSVDGCSVTNGRPTGL